LIFRDNEFVDLNPWIIYESMDYGENPWIWIIHELEVTERFGCRDRRVFQIVSTSGPHGGTACLISGGEDGMKVDPDSVALGSLASKVLRPGEQKAYVTGGIIGTGREGEGGGGKIGSLISEIIRENKNKKIKNKINNIIIF
jgi:hypothetical protein